MVTSSFLPGRGGIESYLAELCSVVAPRLAVVAAGSRDGQPIPLGLPYRTFAGPGSMLVPRTAVVDATVEAARTCGTDRVLFGTPWPLSLIGALAGMAVPSLYVLQARAKRFARFEEQMPDAIDMIQRGLNTISLAPPSMTALRKRR